ncbi:MAG: hypothetical protein AAFN30_15760 [Actinomycetota bacterium]
MTTTQFDFSNDDWDEIAATPVLVGLAVARAEDSGFIGSIREIRSLIAAVGAGGDDGPARSLIDGAAATEAKATLKDYAKVAPEVLADSAVEACGRLHRLLDGTAEAEESLGYRRWVLDVATTVAEAATEQRVRVSPPEAALIGRLTSALGLG